MIALGLAGKRPGPGQPIAVLRGGSWNNTAENLRSANRNRNQRNNRNDNVGFRLASTARGESSAASDVGWSVQGQSKAGHDKEDRRRGPGARIERSSGPIAAGLQQPRSPAPCAVREITLVFHTCIPPKKIEPASRVHGASDQRRPSKPPPVQEVKW